MKGAMLYVNAGKGHYVPAKALADSFIRAGQEAVLEDLFVVFDCPFWELFCKYDWRFLLHHPRWEQIQHPITDNRLNFWLIRWQGLIEKHKKAFKAWYEKEKPDFIISTNFLGGIILPAVVKELNINIPIFQYCADVFDTPKIGVNNMLDKMYFPAAVGIENAIRKNQDPKTLSLCPFPLRDEFETYTFESKKIIREKLGLPDRFTILCSFGGEGIGSPSLLYALAKTNIDAQVVIIGGKSRTTTMQFRRFSAKYPGFPVYHRGFVNNVQDYLAACDIQIGKAGANGVMEAIFMKRPFIVTEVLYTFKASIEFLQRHQVGWCENNIKKQVEILSKFKNDSTVQENVRQAFDNLPIIFGSDLFRLKLINDTQEYYKNKGLPIPY